MKTYRMGFNEVLRLTYRRFWFLLAQIPRLEAEEDLRLIRAGASATTSEAYKAASEHFQGVIGEIYSMERTEAVVMKVPVVDPETGLDPEYDRAGLLALKARIKAEKG